MTNPDYAKLAALALDLITDLEKIGFGPCARCGTEDHDNFDNCPTCQTWDGISGDDCVDLMGAYFNDLRAAGRG